MAAGGPADSANLPTGNSRIEYRAGAVRLDLSAGQIKQAPPMRGVAKLHRFAAEGASAPHRPDVNTLRKRAPPHLSGRWFAKQYRRWFGDAFFAPSFSPPLFPPRLFSPRLFSPPSFFALVFFRPRLFRPGLFSPPFFLPRLFSPPFFIYLIINPQRDKLGRGHKNETAAAAVRGILGWRTIGARKAIWR